MLLNYTLMYIQIQNTGLLYIHIDVNINSQSIEYCIVFATITVIIYYVLCIYISHSDLYVGTPTILYTC